MRSFAFSRPEWSWSSVGLGLRQIDHLVGPLHPRQRDQPIEIGARDRVFGRRHRHLRQAIELAQRFLLDQLGHAGGLDLLGELLDLLGLVVAFAELLLNRLHLLAQEVLALVLADLRLHLRLDLRSELEHFELLDQDPVQVVHPRADVERLQHLLFDRCADGRERGGNEVGEPARLGDVHRQGLQIVGEQRRERHDLLEVGLDVARQRIDLEAVGVVGVFGGRADARAQVGLRRQHLLEAQPRQPLDDQPQAAVGQLEHLVDVRGGADLEQIALPGLFDRRITLREDGDQLAVGDRIVDQADGAFARHGERHERIRKKDRVPKREDRELRRNRERPIADRDVLCPEVLDLIAHRDLLSIA